MAASASHTQAQGGTSFPPFDASTFPSQLVGLGVVFVLLYVVIAKIVTPRLQGILSHRHDTLASNLKVAHAAQAQAQDALKGYEASLAEAKSKAQVLAEEARAKAQAHIAQQQALADADLQKRLDAAEAKISKQTKAAMSHVESLALEAANDIVTALTGSAPAKKELEAALKQQAKA